MTFFNLTNFSYVKTVLTIWSVSQFAIFKNRHVFADPITFVLKFKALARIRMNYMHVFISCFTICVVDVLFINCSIDIEKISISNS